MNNTEYSRPLIQITSANTITEKRREERSQAAIENFLLTGGAAATLGLVANKAYRNHTVANFFNTQILDATFAETAGMDFMDLFSDKTRKPKYTALEWIRKAEELSPFRIARTLQLSHVLTPFILAEGLAIDITSDMVMANEQSLEALLSSHRSEIKPNAKGVKVGLTNENRMYGFRLEDGNLYASKAGGVVNKSDLVLKNASIMLTHAALPKDSAGRELIYRNRVASHLHTIYGGGTTDSFSKAVGSNTKPFLVIGGKTKLQVAHDVGMAYFRSVLETGGKVWDRPTEQITEIIPSYAGSKAQKFFNKFPALNLWTGGHYRQSVASTMKMVVKNNYRMMGIVAGLWGADEMISQVASEDSIFDKGALPAGVTLAVNADIAFSELWSDNFQGYKEAQEYYAPGSTSLMTLGAMPLALGTAAGTISYAKRLYDNALGDIVLSEKNAEALVQTFPDSINKFLPKVLKGEHARQGRYIRRGAVLGTLLALPFLPGALIGESSEEKIDVYSGSKDIEIRKNRWWFTGSGAYEGDGIKYFDKHWYAKMMAETNTKSLYGDIETKNALNPILHPMDYLRDPYKFEKMHEEDRPYPVWGMDISLASFLGKAFEKTIGRVIKPDIINPRLAEELPDIEPGTVVGSVKHKDGSGVERALSTDKFALALAVTDAEASLIEEGKLMAPASATYDPNAEALSWSWEAFKDFVGLKGWLLGLAEDAGSAPNSQIAPQLARSGEMTNIGRDVQEANLGGLFGLTEPQRRYIPTSAGLTKDRVNPLKNNMPDWLPGPDDRHWLDLQSGDPYRQVEQGNSRLPGAGYGSLHKDVEGLNPEDYPDIHKLKILSDVAVGSDAYYQARNTIEKAEADHTLTDYERGMLRTIRKQERQKGVKREFQEYKTEEELSSASLIQKTANLYWEAMSHTTEKALPTEFLTFFRPAGKLLHSRTAVEDYERTQFEGADTAIWDKPMSNFIKPAIIQTARLIDGDYVTEEVKDKRAIEQYFDTLEYVKQRRLYKTAVSEGDTEGARTSRAAYQKTTEGALVSGLDTDTEILRSYISLPKEDKAYFSSFVNASEKDRERIRQVTPDRVSDLYASIWQRKDIIDEAVADGESAAQANERVRQVVNTEDKYLQENNPEEYKKWLAMKNRQSTTFREFLGDTRAEAYLIGTGGIPSKDFSGWDPRIDMDRIKLKALTIGKEDFYKFGFWKQDVQELQRYTSVNEDEEIVEIAEGIRNDTRERLMAEDQASAALQREGYVVQNISTRPGNGDVDLNIETIEYE